MEHRRVLCVGDSLGLPRTDVPYEKTWFYLLKESLLNNEFISRFERALTTDELCGSNWNDYLEFYTPSIVILHIGIVDCAPRYFKRNSLSQKFLALMPPSIQKLYWHIIKKVIKRSPRFADVSLNKFSENLRKYFERCELMNIKKLIVVCIATPGEAMVVKNLQIRKQVDAYNHEITKVASCFSFIRIVNPLASGNMSFYLNDGYHLSVSGHHKMFEQIWPMLHPH
jgi:acyl-CoA thioesterase-1